MDYELNRIPTESFESPEPYEGGLKPFLTGSWMGPGNDIHSELYWVDKNNPKGGVPGNSSNDEQFKNWEYSVQRWVLGGGASGLSDSSQNNSNNSETLKITSPKNLSTVSKKDRQTITVSGFKNNTSFVEYYINGSSIGKSSEKPFNYSYIPSQTPSSDFEDELRAVETDSDGQTHTATIDYSVQQ